MAPNDDVERPRASSAAERQKSIVSMTEFEGMDEYTALQKYILFYRDTRTNPHAEQTQKKKAWWQFWKSGSPTAATPIQDAGAVPDDCKFYPISITPCLATFAAPHLPRQFILC
jgi:H+-transporting ATPase